ncbi:SGNH/GDSL hydrolase family protein [Bacillus salacetis]|uniref:SGNH/GDSL hydrolase family protein n=1 Tax=Bacillus salacetis TaxID=2315464 RepID=UPI003B9E1A4B
MQRLNRLIFISALLLAGLLLYLFFSDKQMPMRVNVETQTASVSEQIEEVLPEKTVEEVEEQLEAVEEEQSPTSSITEEIKNNVREAIEGVINLFNKDLKIVSIGDSLTQGVGDETESGGYVGILNHTFEDNELSISIENFGKRGNRTDQLLKRLGNKEIASSIKNSDVVLITIGANDIMKIVKSNFIDLRVETFEKEKQNYRKRLRAIFNKINELNPDAKVYLIGFYNPFEGYFGDIKELEIIMNRWNDEGKAVTEEYENVSYIPTADLFKDTNLELLSEDYFHPNTSGYKRIAKRVLEYVEEIILEREPDKESIEMESDTITES